MATEKILKIHWPGSKHTLARFIDRDLQVRASEDPTLAARVRGGRGFLEGLIYDLGHPGRGFRTFPKEFDLSVFDYQRKHGLVLAKTHLSELYQRISSKVNPYIEETNVQQKRQDHQKELAAFNGSNRNSRKSTTPT